MWYFYPRPPQGGRPGQAPASVCGRMISIHALRKEGDTATAPRTRRSWYFYPRPPQGGRRGKAGNQYRHHAISIHALRKEGDRECIRTINAYVLFLSTPSARRATVLNCHRQQEPAISIHALRKEGDFRFQPCRFHRTRHFYPRPPQGGRPHAYKDYASIIAFLSTPSARRATSDVLQLRTSDLISIHALREEGDPAQAQDPAGGLYFYPRPPRGGRLSMPGKYRPCLQISIHALRKEGDHVRQ